MAVLKLFASFVGKQPRVRHKFLAFPVHLDNTGHNIVHSLQ